MHITIQAVPDRLFFVNEYILPKIPEGLEVSVHVDKEMSGTGPFFKAMCKYEAEGYRLHLEDDVIIGRPEKFFKYVKALRYVMEAKGIDILNLFAPRRKAVFQAFEAEDLIIPMKPFLWNQALLISPKLLGYLKDSADSKRLGAKHSDVYISEVCNLHRITPYLHVPSLVQHNADQMESTMGHKKSDRRKSPVFSPKFFDPIDERIDNLTRYANEKL